MKYKSCNFESHSNLETGQFEGYASVFGNMDGDREIVCKGAFTKTIQENKNRIKILWQHQIKVPIGLPMEMHEDDKGLYIKGKISDTTQGRDTLILMRDGVVTEMSIGYCVVKEAYDRVRNLSNLQELKLWEISPVTYGANDQAGVGVVKSLDILVEDITKGTLSAEEVLKLVEALRINLKQSEPSADTHLDRIYDEIKKYTGGI